MSLRGAFLVSLLVAAGSVTQLTGQVRYVPFTETRDAPEPSLQALGTTLAAAADSDAAADDQAQEDVLGELDVPGLVGLTALEGNGLVYGAEASQGYGWQHNSDQPKTNGSELVLQPFAGFFHAGHRGHFILAYHPTISLLTDENWDGRVLQRAGFNSGYLLTRRWSWFLSGRSIYGPEVLQELGLLSLGVPNYALPSYINFMFSGSTGLVWRRQSQQQLSLTVADNYTRIQHGPTYDTTLARAQFRDGFGRDSNWFAYAQATRYSTLPDCTRIGFGGGFGIAVGGNTRFGAEAGPEYSAGKCITPVSAVFGGFMHHRFSSWTAITLRAKRDLGDATVFDSRYVDGYSAMFQQKTSRASYLDLGATYLRSAGTPNVPLSHYRGVLFSARYHYRLSSHVSVFSSFQYFRRQGEGALPDRRTWVFLTLLWHSKGTTDNIY